MAPVGAACIALWCAGHRDHAAVLAASLLCLAASVVAGYRFGDFFAVGERFFYPSAWLAFTWLGALPAMRTKRFLAALAAPALCLLLLAQAAYVDLYVTRASTGLAAMYDELRTAPSRDVYCAIYNDYRRRTYPPPHRQGLARFTFAMASAPRLPHYFFLEQDLSAPIPPMGIFNFHGAPGDSATCQ